MSNQQLSPDQHINEIKALIRTAKIASDYGGRFYYNPKFRFFATDKTSTGSPCWCVYCEFYKPVSGHPEQVQITAGSYFLSQAVENLRDEVVKWLSENNNQ